MARVPQMTDPELGRRIILGSGRSGTTWVLDCVADANRLRPVFEPLHPAESILGLRHAYRAIIPGDREPSLEQYFLELAAGSLRSRWIDYRGRRGRLFPAPAELTSIAAVKRWAHSWKKHLRDRKLLREKILREGVLLKCIRANLMAGWLTQSLGFRTVLVVRHPGAVVESQYRLGSIWDPAPVLDRYRANERLDFITHGRYRDLLNSGLSTLQGLTLNWVIENQLPVGMTEYYGYATFYYEDLASGTDSAWQQLCRALDLGQVPVVAALREPSQQASALTKQEGQVGDRHASWRTRLTTSQLGEIQEILDATKCHLYRLDRDAPLRPDSSVA